MISPLQTWQHHEHKGLWPAIGGLAVLMHVGVIGMSVPYLLAWQESSEQNDSVAIPIELVTVGSEPLKSSTSAETAPLESNPPAAERSEPAAVPTTITPSQSPVIAPIAQQPLAPSSSENNSDRSSDLVEPSDPVDPDGSVDSSAPVAPETEPETVPDENEAKNFEPPESPSPQAPSSPVEDSSPEEESLPTNSSEENDSPEESLPTVNGNGLPAPVISDEVGQSVQIRLASVPQYDPVEDFEGEPPELISVDYVGLLRPEAEGCEAVSALATQAPLVYRIGVSEDGSVYSASLQGGQAIAPDSADDRAVACLIKKTGITFSRAVSDEGAKPIDDSLLMTFELSER